MKQQKYKRLTVISALLLATSAAPQLAKAVEDPLIRDSYGDCITYLPFETVKAAVQKSPKPGALASGAGAILPPLPADLANNFWPKAGKIKVGGADVDYDLSQLHMRFLPAGVSPNETDKILDYTTLCQQY